MNLLKTIISFFQKNFHTKILSLLTLLLFSLSFFAQKNNVKQIEIIHADILKYNKILDANRLIGNVVCKHENTLFYCDSMYLFPNQSLKAYGNIRIVSDSLNITAEYVFYDASTKIASIEKNVVCTDNHIQLKTQILQFNTSEHYAYYPSGAEITRQQHLLTSDKGYYFTNSKTLAFKNNVVLTNPDYKIQTDTLFYYTLSDIAHFNAPTLILMDKDYLYCEKGWYDTKNKKAYFSKKPILYSDNKKLYADSLFFDENKNEGYGYKHLRLIDSTGTLFVKGNFGRYNRNTEDAIVTDNAFIMKISDDKKDTLFLSCDTIHYTKKDSNAIIQCLHNGELYHQQFQAKAEYIVYYEKDSTIHLYPSPTFWFDKNEAHCKQSILFLKDNSIDKVELDSNVIIVQEADSVYHNKYNQIAGRKMQIQFFNDSIKTIQVNGNAQVYYFLQNDNHQWTSLNKAKCGKIRVDFSQNEIEKVVFIDQPESIMIPIKKIQPEKEKLPDFQWQPHLRPKRQKYKL